MATIPFIYSKYNFRVWLCLPNWMSNLLCSVDGLHSYVTRLGWGRAPTWPLIMRWAYSTLEHVFRQKSNKSRARLSFSHIASCYQRWETISAVAPWLDQQQQWRASVPILNTYPSLRWHGILSTWCGCRDFGRIGAPDSLTKLSCLSGVPPLQSLPSNTETQLQTRVLSSLSILLACTASVDAWVDGMLSHYYQMVTSKVGQQSSVSTANSYRLDNSRPESQWGENFHTCPDQLSVPHNLL
jgi:hypothetical protein